MKREALLSTWIVAVLCALVLPAAARVKMPSEARENVGGKWALSEKLDPGSVEKDGIIYTRYKKGFATCRADSRRKGDLIQITILPKVQIEGESCVVDRVEKDGFSSCSRLKHVSIPATVKYVGELAFARNGKLESVVCLSNRVEFAMSESKWATGGVFLGSNRIASVKWATEGTPAYAYEAFAGNTKAPYARLLAENAGKDMTYASAQGYRAEGAPVMTEIPSFREFAEERVTGAYNKWQRKKQYESRVQYAERTSSQKREQMKRELFENARNEYINSYAPENINGTLTDYDEDYKVYTIDVPGIGEIFAQVPMADRAFFEDNWTGVDITPTYNIVNNELKVVACEYRVGGRTFVSPSVYDDVADNFSGLDFEARQLDLDDFAEELSAPPTGKGAPQASSPVNTAPNTGLYNPSTYALVIGNENYKYVEPVGYALDDAVTFARYCRNTLGLPAQNIIAVQDVTKGELRRTVRELQGIFEDNGAEKNLIVYYAGHGIPDQKNADSLILPVDAAASDTESCYSLQELYNQLGELGAASVVIYMDACFTGSARGGSQLLATRAGVDFVRSQVEPRGNMVVLSATSANETAQPYRQMGHGIFTYFLLDKLQASKGNVTLGELSDYVTTKVKSQSLSKAGKKQVPSTIVSSTFRGDWRSLPVTLLNR